MIVHLALQPTKGRVLVQAGTVVDDPSHVGGEQWSREVDVH